VQVKQLNAVLAIGAANAGGASAAQRAVTVEEDR
jgi:hypothetical protein